MSNVTPRDIEALVEIFDKSSWDVLKLETAGFKIHLSKNAGDGASAVSLAAHPVPKSAPVAPTPVAAVSSQSTAAAHATSVAPHALVPVNGNLIPVRAPNLGTFYRSPKPGSPPYVDIGQEVEPDTEICLIEVMKLFTTVRAGVKGIVREVCVADSEMVEGEQTLFLVEPRA